MEQLLNRIPQIAVGSSPNLLRLTAFDKPETMAGLVESNRADYCSTERRKAFTFHHPDASFPSVLPRRETNERLTLLSAPSTCRPTARDLYDRMLALYPNRINPGSLWAAPWPRKAQIERRLTYESHPVSRLRRFRGSLAHRIVDVRPNSSHSHPRAEKSPYPTALGNLLINI